MTYEEKFNLILKAINEAKKYTRKEDHTKIHLTDDNRLKGTNLNEVHDILLQLQDDEKIIEIKNIPTKMKPVPLQTNDLLDKAKDYFLIDVLNTFEQWYANHLIRQKGSLENLSEINFNNVAEIMKIIEQELELSQAETMVINFVPSISDLEGYDREDIDDLINTAVRGLDYLKNIGVLKDFTTSEMSVSSEITLNVPRFFEILERVNNLKLKQVASSLTSKKQTKEPEDEEKTGAENNDRQYKGKRVVEWPEDFKWENENFVFGKYGSIGFKSDDRKFILKVLTDKKGGWATIKELKGDKDTGYVRSTIKQIEDRLPEKARKHITIVSTQDDDSEEKPNVGAYRIRVKP